MPRRVRSALTDPQLPDLYIAGARCWYALGVRLSEATTKSVAKLLTSSNPERRPELATALLRYYPARNLRRLYRRSTTAWSLGGIAAWLAAFPDLKPELSQSIVTIAVDHGEPEEAFRAALIWATELNGGDQALRVAAKAILAQDRKALSQGRTPLLRHDIEADGAWADYVPRLNHHLGELGATTLGTAGIDGSSYQPPAANVAEPTALARCLGLSIAGTHGYAGSDFSDLDIDFWARTVRALPVEAVLSAVQGLGLPPRRSRELASDIVFCWGSTPAVPRRAMHTVETFGAPETLLRVIERALNLAAKKHLQLRRV